MNEDIASERAPVKDFAEVAAITLVEHASQADESVCSDRTVGDGEEIACKPYARIGWEQETCSEWTAAIERSEQESSTTPADCIESTETACADGADTSLASSSNDSGIAAGHAEPSGYSASASKSTVKAMSRWIWDLRAPLICLAAIAAIPKLILLWILLVLAKPVVQWGASHLPEDLRSKIQQFVPDVIRRSTFVRDVNEGADQGLPFILCWLYLFCAPFAIVWMTVHWVRGFLPQPRKTVSSDDKLVFAQCNRSAIGNSETNFYHSRVFGLVVFLFFALGIPSFISLAVYERLGVESLVMSSPALGIIPPKDALPAPPVRQASLQSKKEPYKTKLFAHTHGPQPSENTVIQGYMGYWPVLRYIGLEPQKNSVVFVHFYLVSLASAIMVLFLRAWFSFPLNFIADDYDVELSKSGIRRKNLKGWFLSVITINRWASNGGPDTLQWSDVKRLRRYEEGFAKLCPLPETIFQKETLTYKVLNKLAAFMEGVARRPNPGNFLVFSCSESESDFGRSIKINLNDLSRAERSKLLFSVKTLAPHVVIDASVEEQLVGSTVLKDNRYTQLWFDLLTTKSRSRASNSLPPGQTLKNGEYRIDHRMSSGGQATTYLATRRSGDKCVLKEFILATSNSGAMIESAREFEAEVGLLSQLNHPGIVKLEDFFAEEQRLYVALEFAPGRTLRQKVQDEGPLDESEVARIARSTCDAIEYLHGCNPPIVHRDITPENIIVAPDGKIKLIDFSLAVRQDGRPTTDSCGKQAFTPPEQFREEVCVQSDLYALGATLYFLLTGTTPKPISRSSPNVKAPQVSDAFNRIVEQATEPDLSQRYAAVNWLKLDLENLQSSEV